MKRFSKYQILIATLWYNIIKFKDRGILIENFLLSDRNNIASHPSPSLRINERWGVKNFQKRALKSWLTQVEGAAERQGAEKNENGDEKGSQRILSGSEKRHIGGDLSHRRADNLLLLITNCRRSWPHRSSSTFLASWWPKGGECSRR